MTLPIELPNVGAKWYILELAPRRLFHAHIYPNRFIETSDSCNKYNRARCCDGLFVISNHDRRGLAACEIVAFVDEWDISKAGSTGLPLEVPKYL